MSAALDIVEVAHETGLGVEPVAAVHFRLGSRLELHWLHARIVALPRHDRWSGLARAALRDDLNSLHRELTAEVVQTGDGGQDVDERVNAWVERNPSAERYLATLADVRLGRTFDLTTLPVVVREVRSLIHAPADGG
jgi:glutamate dehydrogenase